MPLLGKRPFEPHPLSLRDLTHTDEVWVIRFTDEAFRTYEYRPHFKKSPKFV
jgi:hypothetical protein